MFNHNRNRETVSKPDLGNGHDKAGHQKYRFWIYGIQTKLIFINV